MSFSDAQSAIHLLGTYFSRQSFAIDLASDASDRRFTKVGHCHVRCARKRAASPMQRSQLNVSAARISARSPLTLASEKSGSFKASSYWRRTWASSVEQAGKIPMKCSMLFCPAAEASCGETGNG